MISRWLRAIVPIAAAIVLAAVHTPIALAQTGEPSPIEVTLVAPPRAAPGQIVDVAIQYKVVDLNANALLNYNLFGPARIWTRSPEPPNPIVNTWGPKFEPTEGTITIQLQVNEGTDGQTLRHEVDVSWGDKKVRYTGETEIVFAPPTATPVPTRRPTPVASPTPTPAPVMPATIELVSASFVGGTSATPLTSIQSEQQVGLSIQYTSSSDVRDVVLRVRFLPDVVALDGFERQGATLVMALSSLPSADDRTAIPGSPFLGRVLGYPGGGEEFSLEAVVELELDPGAVSGTPVAARAGPLRVQQRSALDLSVRTDSETVRGGGNIIVHVSLSNDGDATVEGVELRLEGLPVGFAVTPPSQRLAKIPVGGERQERLFTVRVPDTYAGEIQLSALAAYGDSAIYSAPLAMTVLSPAALRVDASADRTAVRAGGSVYIDASVANQGSLTAEQVAVRLIDVTGNLGVLLQTVGDVEPGAQHDLVFVVEISPEFPADVQSSLIVQAISRDAAVSESEPLPLAVACVPRLEASVQSAAARLRAGEPVELLALIRNVGQCPARNVGLSIEGLPSTVDGPPSQEIAFLGPGEVRYAGFAVEIPDRHPQGDWSVRVLAEDQLSNRVASPPIPLTVSGTPVWFTVLFGLLGVVAIAAVVVGLTAFFRGAAQR